MDRAYTVLLAVGVVIGESASGMSLSRISSAVSSSAISASESCGFGLFLLQGLSWSEARVALRFFSLARGSGGLPLPTLLVVPMVLVMVDRKDTISTRGL